MERQKRWRRALAFLLVLGTLTTAAYAAEPKAKFSVTADQLEYDIESGEGAAKGHVVLADELGTAKGAEAHFNSKDKSGILKGGVGADRDGAHLECEEFVMYNEDDMTARGGALLNKEGKTLTAPRVDYFRQRQYAQTQGGRAQLTDEEGGVLNADKIDYDMAGGLAHAYGNVTFASEARKLSGSADKAIYDTEKDGGIVELIGNAQAIQDGNLVRGNTLRLTNNSKAAADGRVKVIYIPEKKEPAPAAEVVAQENKQEAKEEQGILASYRAKRDAKKSQEE